MLADETFNLFIIPCSRMIHEHKNFLLLIRAERLGDLFINQEPCDEDSHRTQQTHNENRDPCCFVAHAKDKCPWYVIENMSYGHTLHVVTIVVLTIGYVLLIHLFQSNLNGPNNQ